MSAKFDEYGDTYRDAVQRSIAFAGRDHEFFTETKARELVELVRAHLGDPAEVHALDVGCGPGETDALLAPHLGRLEGIDVADGVLERARERNPGVRYTSFDGGRFPFDDASFDFAFAVCVVHHVPPADWDRFVREATRVVRPGGIVALLEHNPFNPLTRLAVARCEFDDDAVLLPRRRAERLLRAAGLEPAASRYILFFPWHGAAFRAAERRLARTPLGAQYLVAGRRT